LAVNFRFRQFLIKRGTSLGLFLVFFLQGCSEETPSAYQFQQFGETMGTTFSVKIPRLPEAVNQKDLQDDISGILKVINSTMSTYDSNSELSRLNKNYSTDWIEISPQMAKVLKQAIAVSELTQGAFDITIGQLVNLWGFGPDEPRKIVPDQTKLSNVTKKTGYRSLSLQINPPAIRKSISEVYIDLSALAKGFGVDQIAERLDHLGIKDYLIEIGGELRVKGSKIDGNPWRIAVEKPEEGKRAIEQVIELRNIAVATSGDYRNFFKAHNMRFSHTIDPKTGSPVLHKLASVTVLDKSAMRADAFATAFMVMGADTAFELAEQQKLAALFIIRAGNEFEKRTTLLFPSGGEHTQ